VPQALALQPGRGRYGSRSASGGTSPATRTDVWISATWAVRATSVRSQPPSQAVDLLTVDCYPFHDDRDVNARDFEFDVPLPPTSAGARAAAGERVRTDASQSSRSEGDHDVVDGATPVMHATDSHDGRVRGALPSSVGKTIVAGWKRDRTRMTRVVRT